MRALALSIETAKYMFVGDGLSNKLSTIRSICFKNTPNPANASNTSFPPGRGSVIIQVRVERQAGGPAIVTPGVQRAKLLVPQEPVES